MNVIFLGFIINDLTKKQEKNKKQKVKKTK